MQKEVKRAILIKGKPIWITPSKWPEVEFKADRAIFHYVEPTATRAEQKP